MAVFEMTEEGFNQAVQKRMEEKKISRILAVYEVFDEYRVEEIQASSEKPACGPGCAICCRQLVACDEAEMNEILKYLQENYSRKYLKKIRRRAKPIVEKFVKY